ncbi:MAG TPA: amidohydrolase family protein [Gemmata sp.]|nr:amidohydrolase family protein [Gemmata sp.]
MTTSHTITARWIFPVSSPPLLNGTITLRGETIEAVSPRGDRTPDEDLGNAAIIPGLVNAHTHLDLSGARAQIPPTDPEHFTDWLRGVIAYRRSRSLEQVRTDIQTGLSECLRCGTTLLGDITADGGGSWEAIAAERVRGVVFRELIGLNAERAEAARIAGWKWYQAHPATTTCKPALSPHSPYSARESLLNGVYERATVAIHLAESPGEMELIRSHSGPFVLFLQQLGAWDESGLIRSIDGIIAAHRSMGTTLFIHGNYLQPEVVQSFTPGMSIVYCPRTHAAFKHPPHPFREFLARGARVCLGTDSLASNPDLDIIAEARLVHQLFPDFPGDQLLRMVTLSGAEALGWSDMCGSLEVGKSADLVVVPLPDREADPHELLLANHSGERRTMFRGEWREYSKVEVGTKQ